MTTGRINQVASVRRRLAFASAPAPPLAGWGWDLGSAPRRRRSKNERFKASSFPLLAEAQRGQAFPRRPASEEAELGFPRFPFEWSLLNQRSLPRQPLPSQSLLRVRDRELQVREEGPCDSVS